MKDIPQPASEPYSKGDQVKIYIDSTDPDAEYHGTVCEVIAVLNDDLNTETGRNTDAYSYRLRGVTSGAELPILFRHHDLVPVRNSE